MRTLLLFTLACNGGATTDADGDGIPASDDCDDNDASVGILVWYKDADQDGVGDALSFTAACDAPSGHVADSGDCDDADGSVHPGAAERCDGVDQDCDSAVDEDASDASTYFLDEDGDGVGLMETTQEACEVPEGYAELSGDCDDGEDGVYPGAPLVCGDGLDNDCDGLGDCGLALEGQDSVGAEWIRVDGTSSEALAPHFIGGEQLAGAVGPDLVFGRPMAQSDEVSWMLLEPEGGRYTFADADRVLHAHPDELPSDSAFAVGDIDGDGVTDLAVGRSGVPYDRETGADSPGAVYVAINSVRGDPFLHDDEEIFTIHSEVPQEAFGAAVVMGDLSGDGVVDLVIGAPGADDEIELFGQTYGEDSGRLYYIEGPISTWDNVVSDLSPSVLRMSGAEDARMGEHLQIVDDIDGDGSDDLVVAMPRFAGAYSNTSFSGAVALILEDLPRDGELIDEASVAIFDFDSQPNSFGVSVSGTGDTNGDGYGELLIGAPEQEEGGQSAAGCAWLLDGDLLRRPETLNPTPGDVDLARFVGGGRDAELGASVHGPGDLNADDLGEVWLGAPGYQASNGNQIGAALLYSAPFSGTVQADDAIWIFEGQVHRDRIGEWVTSIPDTDGWGMPELVVYAQSTSSTATAPHGALFLIPTDGL